jgi:hypothetical protein
MNYYLRNIIKNSLRKEILKEETIIPPDIPGTINFWHGGNLDNYDDIIAQKNGRYEYGPGLYVTTHYNTAQKYSKGSRKLYLATIAEGKEISEAFLSMDAVKNFIKMYVIGTMKKYIYEQVQRYEENGQVKAYIFNNIILNNKAIKSTATKYLRSFYVANGIDYEIVDNAFGWGEKMLVLYNMKKIVNVIQIKPGDKISVFDLH